MKATTNAEAATEKAFVYGEKTKTQAPAEMREGKGAASIGRVPLTTRVRTDFAAALKRASLERQLNGVFPNTLQDILEEALRPWLDSNGYLN
jgi:hypothetical protein